VPLFVRLRPPHSFASPSRFHPVWREEALNQGDLFKSIGLIKVLIGDLNAGQDLTLTLNSIMRTPTPAAATELLIGLRGLLTSDARCLPETPNLHRYSTAFRSARARPMSRSILLSRQAFLSRCERSPIENPRETGTAP
jgi:hypothetical protein